MLSEINSKFIDLVAELSISQIEQCTGMGLVLYSDLKVLSKFHCALVSNTDNIPKLCLGDRNLATYLLEISNYNHPYHDGFHFIRNDGFLTHVSQFFSPPIIKPVLTIPGRGARTFCAQSGSNIEGVLMTASISSMNQTYLFIKGSRVDKALILRAKKENCIAVKENI